MEILIPLVSGGSLKIADCTPEGEDYPTTRLQKGYLWMYADKNLAEEGVGFGVPVLKRGLQTFFPGSVELNSAYHGSIQEVTADFKIYLEERFAKPGFKYMKSNLLYTIKNLLAALIRHFPPSRGLLVNISNALRWIFGWQTVYQESGFCTNVKLIHLFNRQSGIVNVEVNSAGLSQDGITEVVVMNELGARHFGLFRDSDGTTLQGKEIGCWDEVRAESASFIDENDKLAFTLNQVAGTTLFRGRELIGSRLAWAGFGYSYPTSIERIQYELRIERLR